MIRRTSEGEQGHSGARHRHVTVSRHLINSDELATADPAQVIRLLRPCVLSLAARPDHS